MSECSEQLFWWFVWGDTIPCLVLNLGSRVWSGRGLGHRISNCEIQLMFKGKAYSQNAPRRPLWKKKDTMKESNGSCVLQIHVIFPLMQVNVGKIRNTGFHSTICQLPLFLSSWCWCATEGKSGLPAFLRSLVLKSLQGQNSCWVTRLNP